MPSSKVIVDNRFGKVLAEFDRGVQRSLGQAAGTVIATARAAPTRYDIEDVKAKVQVGQPRRGRRGWELDILWTDWRVWFFERGTYAKRGALRTRRANTVEGSRGIKPQRFLRRATRAGRVALIAAVQRNLPR